MKRRKFIQNSSAGLGALFITPSNFSFSKNSKASQDELPKFKVRRLTNGPKHHFFGYYGMSPWNRSETKLVCLESDFTVFLGEFIIAFRTFHVSHLKPGTKLNTFDSTD